MQWRIFGFLLTFAFAVMTVSHVIAETPTAQTPPPKKPEIAKASDEGERAITGFQMPKGFAAKLFAAEPDVANPVAFYVDNDGKVYVCETFRQKKGVEDNRGHGEWLDDDLAAQSIDDRLAYLKKHLKDKLPEYSEQDDRIRVLEDTDGDGKVDKAVVFAEHFNEVLAGTGAGVLAHRGNVYYTCIPDLWMLRDDNGDGKADIRKSLHRGYGVRYAFRGHDMHGLIIGPDGRLYWSIGDRGYNVTTDGTTWHDAESGAVFRCELDGSNLEVFATGLRNPQELAFDEYGNLFTGDNNSDSGDKARFVYVVRGGDTGWRMAYQYLDDRGPFNREKIWHPQHENQPAYIVPPIINVSDGPSGLIYYPGVGLPESFDRRFLLCDFRGQASTSGVRSFRTKSKGAFFELVDQEQPFWNILATDIALGPDGGLYLSDWVHGWDGLGKGRIYKFRDETTAKSALVSEVRELLSTGLDELPTARLVELLGHKDQRIRQEAQFALVRAKEFKALTEALGSDEQLARIHAIWGLAQASRLQGAEETVDVTDALLELTSDSDGEIRAQAYKALGELSQPAQREKIVASLIIGLKDKEPRAQYFAAMSINAFDAKEAIEPVLSLLEKNADNDPIVRHGCIMALAGVSDSAAILAASKGQHRSARLGCLLALRRHKSPLVAEFLSDVDTFLIDEAARAIHDMPIPGAEAKLAAALGTNVSSQPFTHRALTANYRIGDAKAATAIANIAVDSNADEMMRLEAITMLDSWAEPSARDRVLGMWRPLEKRDAAPAAAAIRNNLARLIASPDKVRVAALKTAAKLGIQDAAPELQKVLADLEQPASSRRDALVALASLKDIDLDETLKEAMKDESPLVQSAALGALVERSPQQGADLVVMSAVSKHREMRQQAYQLLAKYPDLRGAEKVLSLAMKDWREGKIPADTQLDLLLAAKASKSPVVLKAVETYEKSLDTDDPLSVHQVALEGGDYEKGEDIFFNRREVSCVRCHKIDNRGGEVGPDLSAIGAEKKRDYLLEALVLPSKSIAKNFESVQLITDEGKPYTGIVKEETDTMLKLITAQSEIIEIPIDSIEVRRPAKSAMPDDLIKQISASDLRDLVEYLSERKTATDPEKHE